MANKEKVIKELKEALDGLDITNKYRLNLIRAIEYLQEEHASEDLEDAFITGTKWQKEVMELSWKDIKLLDKIFMNEKIESGLILGKKEYEKILKCFNKERK